MDYSEITRITELPRSNSKMEVLQQEFKAANASMATKLFVQSWKESGWHKSPKGKPDDTVDHLSIKNCFGLVTAHVHPDGTIIDFNDPDGSMEWARPAPKLPFGHEPVGHEPVGYERVG